jgi:hypothetical protein
MKTARMGPLPHPGRHSRTRQTPQIFTTTCYAAVCPSTRAATLASSSGVKGFGT